MSPQISFDNRSVSYSFEGESIIAVVEDSQDVFDFSEMPDGEADWSVIETILEFSPVVRAERVDGILSVELVNFISEDASEQEKFPEWMEV